jgi:hypothetical protein
MKTTHPCLPLCRMQVQVYLHLPMSFGAQRANLTRYFYAHLCVEFWYTKNVHKKPHYKVTASITLYKEKPWQIYCLFSHQSHTTSDKFNKYKQL